MNMYIYIYVLHIYDPSNTGNIYIFCGVVNALFKLFIWKIEVKCLEKEIEKKKINTTP